MATLRPNRNEPQYWVGALSDSEQYREAYARRYEWSKLKKIWNTGALHTVVETNTPQQPPGLNFQSSFVNWIWSFCQTFIPAVYYRQPHIRIFPKQPMYGANAPLVESITNALVQRCAFRKEEIKSIADALIYGHGWTKIGWYTKPGQVPDPETPPDQDALQREGTIDTDFNMSLGEGYMVRVNPENILVDNYASCYEEMRWIAQTYYAPLDAVKADPYFKNKSHITSVDLLAENDIGNDIGMPVTTDSNRNSHNEQWVRIWEIWDRIDRKVRWLCSGCDRWNRVVNWPFPELKGFPFKPLLFTEGCNQFYPVSVLLPWLPLVEELSTLRTIRMRHLHKMIPKVLLPQGLLDEEQMDRFGDPDVEFQECNGDPNAQKPFIFEGMKPDANLYASEEAIKSDIRDISGFSELLSGQVPFSRIAATTSAIMEKNATVRFDHYSERLADHILDCVKDMFLIARKMMVFPQVVEVTGDAEPEMVQITAEALRGEYHFQMELEDLSISTRQQKVKEAFDALQTLGQVPNVKLYALARDFLSALGKHDIAQYLDPPQGPPLDPNYENKLMSQGVPVRPTPMEDFALHLRIHRQFMQSPAFSAIQRVPQLVALFSEHIQETNQMAQAQMMAAQGPRRGGGAQGNPLQNIRPGASMQQGGALSGSQPVGGQRMQ